MTGYHGNLSRREWFATALYATNTVALFIVLVWAFHLRGEVVRIAAAHDQFWKDVAGRSTQPATDKGLGLTIGQATVRFPSSDAGVTGKGGGCVVFTIGGRRYPAGEYPTSLFEHISEMDVTGELTWTGQTVVATCR